MALSTDSASLLDISALKALANMKVAVVYTEWNDHIISKLREGASHIAAEVGATITHELAVPGCFELPYACKQLFLHTKEKTNAPEAIIAFGTVIRGGTPHFEYVCKAVTEGLTLLNVELDVPVIFGVLTLDNEQQAIERLGGPHGHKGEEAMITALKMIQLKRSLS